MIKYDGEKQKASIQNALNLRPTIEAFIDALDLGRVRNLYFLGIGGT